MNASATQTNPARRARWPRIVVGMLVAHALLMSAAVVIAVRSPYRVVPNYYERAVNWDNERAAQERPSQSTPTSDSPKGAGR